MKVIKRDKTTEVFQFEKIRNAISRAFEACGKEVPPSFFECIEEKYKVEEEGEEKQVHVEQIQDDVENCLMEVDKEVAKAYIIYRYNHKLIRENKDKLIKGLTKKLMAEDVENQNANLDEHSFGGRMGEATRLVTKEYALDYCMSRKARRKHLNNEIYVHDMDSYAVGMHNCLTLPLDDLLAKGFNTRQCDVRPANSVNTAMQLVAVLFQLQSLQQFGGVSASHIDWTMVPYVRKSFFKHYRDGMKYLKNEEIEKIDNITELSIDDEFYKKNRKVYNFAMDMTNREIHQAVEGMYHNLNTLQSRSGNQLPFSSINYGTCTLTEGRMVTKAILEVSIEGMGRFHKTSIFPCGIFQMMKGVNRKEGEPNYDLFKLALESTSKRLYPNYANCDWSGNAGYDVNDPRTYFSTMGCHAKDTPIIMADGTKKMVQDIVVGDKIMGVNNQIRTVESLIQGNDRLFKIKQSRAESYVVNEGHILSLVYTASRKYRGFNKGDKVNISVHDFMKIPVNERRFFKGYKSSYELSEKEFLIPPYILGLWLGDGNSHSTRFSVNINETQLIEDLREYAISIGKKLSIREDSENCLSVDICDYDTKSEGNKFRQALKKLNLFDNKHIPEEYFYGSKEQRSALLAGLLNTDGWARIGRGRKSVCFGNTNINLIDGAKRLADSLGYNTNIICARGETIGVGLCEGSVLKPYYHLNIHSYDDPHLMEHKRSVNSTSKRDFDTSTITIEEVEAGDFYGFELDGDRLYLINDGTVTHNCRTANGWDVNGFGQLKDGRGNICPVTIIMPTLAMQAKQFIDSKASKEDRKYSDEEVVAHFMRVLDRNISDAKDMLIERFEWICSQNPASAKFMWENNTMAGYVPEEGIRSALKHGTIVIGQLGLAETLQILIHCDHTTEQGMELAKKIEGLFKKRCAEFKEEYQLNFGVYYTPAENLCYTAMKRFRDEYGVIENVSDREYFTNSMHVPVWHEMTPFEKIDIEAQLTGYSSAGCITYVELPSTTKHNIEALETMVNYAMDKDIPYFAINVPNDICNDCGYTDEIGEVCPQCGSKNIQRLRRVTGYLTGDYKTAFNYGKQIETEERVKHNREV